MMFFAEIKQMVVIGEVVLAFLFLRRRPGEVNANPAEAGVREHFHLTRLRMSEMNVYADPVRDAQRRRKRGRGGSSSFTGCNQGQYIKRMANDEYRTTN